MLFRSMSTSTGERRARFPQFRFRMRTLLLLIAMLALLLAGVKVYREGAEAHWVALKLRIGNAATHRAAATEAWELALEEALGPQGVRVVIPALVVATRDRDTECRANAVDALAVLAVLDGSELAKRQTLPILLEASSDHAAAVRQMAIHWLGRRWGDRDVTRELTALLRAASDPSVNVRETALFELGHLGGVSRETQQESVPVLISALQSHDSQNVRITAAGALGYFGDDQSRDRSPDTPDVVPVLVAGLKDPSFGVRCAIAQCLGRCERTANGQDRWLWSERKAAIIPALEAALDDPDPNVRRDSKSALLVIARSAPHPLRLTHAGEEPRSEVELDP